MSWLGVAGLMESVGSGGGEDDGCRNGSKGGGGGAVLGRRVVVSACARDLESDLETFSLFAIGRKVN